MHRRSKGIRGKLKQDSKFRRQTYANQQSDITQECPDIELKCQSLEIVKKLCYLGNKNGARAGAFDSGVTSIRSGWCKFRDLVPLLASRGLPSTPKSRLYSASICSNMIYGSEIWLTKEEDVIEKQE